MSYFNVGEIYISGTNRILGSTEDHNPMNDNLCQIVEITEIFDGHISYKSLAMHPDCPFTPQMMSSSFVDTEANREWYKKLNNSTLLLYAHYLMKLPFISVP